VEIGRALNRAGVAHGDLQHGNILVANGKPKLIDYDGMYVPALRAYPDNP
jgi:thiamine kinase-like enzyme